MRIVYNETVAEALFYHEDETGLFVRALGHVTAAVSTDLRELILNRLALPAVPPLFAVDLSECDYMDSTFMGLLVGFHKRYKQLTQNPLTILRPTPECLKLLRGLGILPLLRLITGKEPASPREWTSVQARQNPAAEILLQAHEELSGLSPENERKFEALRSVLKQQIDKNR